MKKIKTTIVLPEPDKTLLDHISKIQDENLSKVVSKALNEYAKKRKIVVPASTIPPQA